MINFKDFHGSLNWYVTFRVTKAGHMGDEGLWECNNRGVTVGGKEEEIQKLD